MYVLEQLLLRPAQLCGILLAGCGSPMNPFDSNWTLPLPPKPLEEKPRSETHSSSSIDKQRRPLRILQISDIHFDFSYKEGTEAKCHHPVCCNGNDRREAREVHEPAGFSIFSRNIQQSDRASYGLNKGIQFRITLCLKFTAIYKYNFLFKSLLHYPL